MSIIAEICLYLLIVLGIICATISTCNTNNIDLSKKYIRKKGEGEEIILELIFSGVSDENIQEISYELANGNFDNIYDLVDKFEVFKKDM